MSFGRSGLLVVMVAFVVAIGFLYRENNRLREENGALRRRDTASKQVGSAGASVATEYGSTAVSERPSQSRVRALVDRLREPRPRLEDRKETRAERRVRRSAEIRAFLGREGGETEDEYRARLVPIITGGLAGPRDELNNQREELEQRAQVTPEQREQLDTVISDVFDEGIELANAAVASGDLTPYERNWGGVLSVTGAMGAILESAQGRIGGVLTPEQLRIFQDAGFEWGEYLAVQAPWEKVNPPPPPSPDDGS